MGRQKFLTSFLCRRKWEDFALCCFALHVLGDFIIFLESREFIDRYLDFNLDFSSPFHHRLYLDFEHSNGGILMVSGHVS